MKRSKTLEFDSIHLKQIFNPAHKDKQPSRGVALARGNTVSRYTFSRAYVESMHPVGELWTRTYTEASTHTRYTQKRPGSSRSIFYGFRYLLLLLL